MKPVSFLLLLSCFISSAKIPESVKAEVDQRIEHQLNPSIVIGVFADGKTEFYAKGYQNKAIKQVATSKTVYEIGSITKTFTSLLLAKLVDEKKLQLKDPVQKLWPGDFKLIDNKKQAITLLQLATHTSGLPRMPNNLNPFSSDPYATYDRQQLLTGISQAKLKTSGENYGYSNLAVGLLGETMSQIENTSYNDLIATKVLKPLHLNQTYMLLDQVPETVLAQGYTGKNAVDPWQFQALAGAGSIRSSIEDLLAYGIAHLDHSKHELKTAMQMATTTHYQQGHLKVGLGWHIDTKGYIWHNGGTSGFSSIIVFDPIQQKVVAGITNTNPEHNIDDIAFHLMDRSIPMIDHEFPVPIANDQLDQFIGRFNHQGTNNHITIIKENNQLFFDAHKQPLQLLTFVGNNTFKIHSLKIKLAFNRNDNQINSLILDGWGGSQTYHKVINDD